MNANPASRIRSISLFTATCIVIANMIGVGVFTSLGFQVGDLPTGFAIAALWIVGGISAMCGALVYGELAAALPRSGGEYHLLSATLHPSLGFLAGWLSITVGFAVPVALAAMAFGEYFHRGGVFLVALALSGFPPTTFGNYLIRTVEVVSPINLSLGVVMGVTLVHLCGTKVGGRFQVVATVSKVALVVVLIVAGAMIANPQPVSFLPQPGDWGRVASVPFATSLVFVMYAYTGWNATAYIVGEVRQPSRNVPLSVLIGTLIVTVLYVLVNCVFLRTAPLDELSASHSEVAYVAARHIFGEQGGRLMAGLICFGLISSVSAMTWIGPRVSVAMGEDWRLLGFLARKTKGGVPAVAILAQGAIVFVLILSATFESVLKYIQLSLTISSSLTVFGIFALRIRRPDLPRPCRCWGYPVTPLIFLAVNLWMFWFTLKGNPKESLAGLATLLLGLVIYLLSKHKPNRADFEAVREVPSDDLTIEKIALPPPAMQSAPPPL